MAVFDASAVLVLLNSEPGAEVLIEALPGAVISAVNVSEVVAKLAEQEMPEAAISEALEELGLEVISFDADQALAAGLLSSTTRGRGLSLGDRACLALGMRLRLPVLTADRIWSDLDLDAEVQLVR